MGRVGKDFRESEEVLIINSDLTSWVEEENTKKNFPAKTNIGEFLVFKFCLCRPRRSVDGTSPLTISLTNWFCLEGEVFERNFVEVLLMLIHAEWTLNRSTSSAAMTWLEFDCCMTFALLDIWEFWFAAQCTLTMTCYGFRVYQHKQKFSIWSLCINFFPKIL